MTANKNQSVVLPEAVREFSDTLDCGFTSSLPNMVDTINHKAKYTRPQVDMQPGVYLTPDAVREWGPASSYNFVEQRGHKIGRENSRNHVFFGRFYEHYANEQMLQNHEVAVKPVREIPALLGELAMLQYMGTLGIPTLQPIGMTVNDTQKGYLLTKFEQPVLTMDVNDWDDFSDAEKWDQLHYVIDTLALLHIHGLFHGDADFKNMAYNDTGDLIVVDPEFMVSARQLFDAVLSQDASIDATLRERNMGAITRSMSAEFTRVCESIDRHIILKLPENHRKISDLSRLKLYKRYVFEPYIQIIEDANSVYVPVLREAYGRMMFERKRRATESSL